MMCLPPCRFTSQLASEPSEASWKLVETLIF
jgi:hypothetical protein